MKTTSLKVILIAKTEFHLSEREGFPWEKWETDTENSAEKLVEMSGRLCYSSWHKPNPATRRSADYIGHILDSQHFSTIEHAGFSVTVTGASRSLSHELVRHRHHSFSQLSQRFFDESDAAFVVPPLFRGHVVAEQILEEHMADSLRRYSELVKIGREILESNNPSLDKTAKRKQSREAARAVLPNETETMLVMSANHRSWREFFEKRGNPHADAEIRELAVAIFKIAREVAPALYQDMRLVSEDGFQTIVMIRGDIK